jgi:threonylcarbamoyladenosine tRNA methylthiotransferase MtaB
MAKIAIYTIGCKVNQGESEELKINLAEAGHIICINPYEADLCVVNTCTVTAESDRKCRKLIRLLDKKGARAIVAAGCYAQIKPQDLLSLPGVIKVLSNYEKDSWSIELERMLPSPVIKESGRNYSRSRGFIKVQDGCERRCSYCIVPEARGRERSRPLNEVMALTTKWLEKGTQEIILCGVNLGRFNLANDFDLAGLIREVVSIGEGYRVRLSSIELEDLRIAWLEEWAASDRVCPHLHLPLQSGDAEILQDMGRGYSPDDFIAIANNLRCVWPEATLTTEVIVGYPGESDAAFAKTLAVLEEVRPSRVHVFRFSRRPGTPAWNKKDEVSTQKIENRSAILRDLADRWRIDYALGRRGEVRHLLVERLVDSNGIVVAMGTTEDYIKASLENPPDYIRTGQLIEAKICGMLGGRTWMEMCNKDQQGKL